MDADAKGELSAELLAWRSHQLVLRDNIGASIQMTEVKK
jgi:hypothetical protein